MTDIWVCSNCASINRQRSNTCYKCGARQEAATGAMAEHRVVAAAANRVVRPYRGSTLRFVVASVLILAVAALGVAILLDSLRDVDAIRAALVTAITTETSLDAGVTQTPDRLLVPAVVHLALLLAAVAAFGAWLSRVVSNVPALGGGLPGATPTKAFIYPFIPLLNLIKVPGMMQDVLYRLDPQAGGFFMVVIAWFGLVGSYLVSVIGGWVIGFLTIRDATTAILARSKPDLVEAATTGYDRLVALEVATSAMVAGGAVVLVLVMARIERRARARDQEIQALVAGAMPDPGVDGAPQTPSAEASAAEA